jgi:F420H(2)-dependent quinone reductase
MTRTTIKGAAPMPIEGEYEPSKWDWVREQIETYEATGGAEANTLRDTGIPIMLVTMHGHASGKVRKIALMRVEHDGEYALIGSKGGRPEHPGWYHNLVADPNVVIQDGPTPFDAIARLVEGDERATWWERGVAVYPTYEEYRADSKDHREIPIFIASPVAK